MNVLASLNALVSGTRKDTTQAPASGEAGAASFASLMGQKPNTKAGGPEGQTAHPALSLDPELMAEFDRLSDLDGADLNAELSQFLAKLPANGQGQSNAQAPIPGEAGLTPARFFGGESAGLPNAQGQQPGGNPRGGEPLSLEQFIEVTGTAENGSADGAEPVYAQGEVDAAFSVDKLPPEVLDLMKDILKAEAPSQAQVQQILAVADEVSPEIRALVQQFLDYKMSAVAQGSEYSRLVTQGRLNQLVGQQPQPQPQMQAPIQIQPQPSQVLMAMKGADGVAPLPSSAEPAPITDLFGAPRPTQAMEQSAIVLPRGMSGNLGADLAAALGNRLTLQVRDGVREATVRLDPPELGKVDFSVRTENDRVSVVINTTVAHTRDLVAQHLDRLRADLMGIHDGEIDVQVGYNDDTSGSNQQQGRQDGVAANFSGNETMDETNPNREQSEHWLSINA